MHEAVAQFETRPLLGFGEIGRYPQIRLALAFMASCPVSLAIGADCVGEVDAELVGALDRVDRRWRIGPP
jgi:hypothetical protein